MSIPEILDELKRLLPGDVPPVMAISYGCQIARCGMYGAHPVHKMGYNGDVGTTEEDLWPVGGSYVFPTGIDIKMSGKGAVVSGLCSGVFRGWEEPSCIL